MVERNETQEDKSDFVGNMLLFLIMLCVMFGIRR